MQRTSGSVGGHTPTFSQTQRAAGYRHRVKHAAEREGQRIAADDERRRRELSEAQEKQRLRIAAVAKAKLDALHSEAEALRRAQDIRNYVKAVVEALGEDADVGDVEQWSRWALAEADHVDPITSGRSINAVRELLANKQPDR
jgi:hypothetical protein